MKDKSDQFRDIRAPQRSQHKIQNQKPYSSPYLEATVEYYTQVSIQLQFQHEEEHLRYEI